jgi:hypothetical protein
MIDVTTHALSFKHILKEFCPGRRGGKAPYLSRLDDFFFFGSYHGRIGRQLVMSIFNAA